MSTFRERLRAAAKARNWEQVQVAQESGIPIDRISKWWNGKRGKRFDPADVQRLADALGIDLEWLLTGRGTMELSPRSDQSPARAAAVAWSRAIGLPEHAITHVQGLECRPGMTARAWLALIEAAAAGVELPQD